ncbi:MAG: exodeoxyribonuclease VII large subunit [Candidatus Nanopelagicales bacterium]|nr:exodeoxyribonuclease VII large subunit [Candidatus Nanopelagicales bacterium]
MTAQAAAPPPQRDGKSPEQAFPVREVSLRMRDYIARLGRIWVEGQLLSVQRRNSLLWLELRDPEVEASLSVVLPAVAERGLAAPLEAGQRVLLQGQFEFWMKNGRITLRASQVRPVGIGELLATLERRKQQLAAEGLFAAARKRPLPLLPRRIGLITGVNAQARHDVVTNAQLRWPGAAFEVREGPVQGPQAVPAIIAALQQLDALDDVDVIVIARGGGSLEDLLPFSDEALIRAVAAARTPVVSAIGHEQDAPILDLVADLRASTPTDAGKRVVPDWAEESRRTAECRTRLDRTMLGRLEQERTWLEQTRSRPALADPAGLLPRLEEELATLRSRGWRALDRRVTSEHRELEHLRARARGLSPLATLDRGYAIVKGPDGHYVRDAGALAAGDAVRVAVASGHFGAQVTDVASAP